MRVEVSKATVDEQPVLANLLELYAHDFSEIFEMRLGADGRFGYAELPLYWQESNRHPFLVKVDDKLAGFVLLRKQSLVSGDARVWDVSEFFIARGYRRHHIGTQAAHELWRQLSGDWEVRVMEKNHAARAFWQRAIDDFMGFTIDAAFNSAKGWHVFSFNTEARRASPVVVARRDLEKEEHD